MVTLNLFWSGKEGMAKSARTHMAGSGTPSKFHDADFAIFSNISRVKAAGLKLSLAQCQEVLLCLSGAAWAFRIAPGLTRRLFHTQKISLGFQRLKQNSRRSKESPFSLV